MTIDYRVGDTRDLTAAIPDGSVSLVASSPPFLALRSYLPAGDDKHAEIGSEADPATFLDTLLALTAEWGRVLAPWGSIAIELGDTYSGSGGAGGDYGPTGLRAGQDAFDGSQARTRSNRPGQYGTDTGPPRRVIDAGWPRAKSLALIPQLYATSLAYGRNILTGTPLPDGPWLVRNVIVWHRPNPAVGALGDKFRPSTSYIVVATRSAKRWFDLTAVRTDSKTKPASDLRSIGRSDAHDQARAEVGLSSGNGWTGENAAGAPPLDTWFDSHDTWTITTQPSRLAHYAMWPPRLAERLILSMCPLEVCSVCGEPRRRVETATHDLAFNAAQRAKVPPKGLNGSRRDGGASSFAPATFEALGWTDCGCVCPKCDGTEWYVDEFGHEQACHHCFDGRAFRPGTVLDPFAGSATTCCVAELHQRNSIGIDLDPRNAQLVDARMAECKRALFGTMPEMVGQMEMAL